MNYLNLLPSSIITSGINRACMVDVENDRYCVIPNSLADLFQGEYSILIKTITDKLSDYEKDIFKDYILFLESNNFAIVSEKSMGFIPFTLNNFEIPYAIQSAVIDFNNEKGLETKMNAIKNINTHLMQFRIYFAPSPLFLQNLFECLEKIECNNVELIFNHNKNFTDSDYEEYFFLSRKIARIIVMGYSETKWIIEKSLLGVKSILNSSTQCGIICKSLFNTTLDSIMLSNSYNSCLYKKISIDINGNIKNCPSISNSYGNIKDTTIEEALNKPDFKKYWNINKNQIDICKDCEYRHICTDCRAYLDNPQNIYSKPLKCGYDPYTNKWEEWSTNPLKEKAIEFYGMQELVKKE